MPTVGKRKFPYNPAGEKAAANYAKKTGKKMVVNKKLAAAEEAMDKKGSKKSPREKALEKRVKEKPDGR